MTSRAVIAVVFAMFGFSTALYLNGDAHDVMTKQNIKAGHLIYKGKAYRIVKVGN